MGLLVQKFGGTSTATPESRALLYQKALEAAAENQLIVVVSAMGRVGAPYATDTLLNMLKDEYAETEKRELDMIFNCGEAIAGCLIAAGLQKRGKRAAYLTGWQAGIITEKKYTDAGILRIERKRLNDYLNQGFIVLVGGGQGITEDGEITTLGRGGSDTTACSIGVAVDADRIEVYTDVNGIMTADPRVVENAVLLPSISHTDCINFANCGAKVMHPRAVEAGRQKEHIPLYVKSTFSDQVGTLIGTPAGKDMTKTYLVGATSTAGDKTLLSLIGANLSKSGLMTECSELLAANELPFSDLCLNDRIVSLKVKAADANRALNLLHNLVVKYLL